MIWRLMAAIMTISEPGGATLVSDKSDWPSQEQCTQIIQDFYSPPKPTIINGKRVTIKIQASCVPVAGEDGLLVQPLPSKLPLLPPLPPPPAVAYVPPPPAYPPPGYPQPGYLPPPPQVYVEPWDGPYYGPSPMAPSIYEYDERRLYRRGDLPPWQRLAPY
jgi:hypothetical protein